MDRCLIAVLHSGQLFRRMVKPEMGQASRINTLHSMGDAAFEMLLHPVIFSGYVQPCGC